MAAPAERHDDASDRLFVTALARGLEILRCFNPATPELGTSEIARLTGLPQPTVWRLCHTLVALGYLVAVPGRPTLRPGVRLLGLGQAVLATEPIAAVALPYMDALARQHEGAVSLGARDGLDMIYLQRCQGTAIVRADLRVGSRVPLATSATGWAYIAGLDAAGRKRVLAELRAARRDDWPAVEPLLRQALTDFEMTGYVVNLGALHPHINSVAVPVKSADGAVVLSLSAGGISPLFDPAKLDEIGRALKALAADLAPLLAAPVGG